jgi:collagenase-like PrtC family protease
MNKLPELLAPCGSYEALVAAVEGGADAVYFGGTAFNARMNAKNFDRDGIRSAVAYCHEKGVKAYITLNTQIYDRELKQALEQAAFCYEAGADALIVADVGLTELIRKHIPDLELHASTQMTAHSLDGAERLYGMGFKRVVGARELSRDNIRTLCTSNAEIELFIHGAICVSVSGQCLMSAMLGGRSGNRGQCAQPCRMCYNGEYPLSVKDMCLATHIPELIDMGVASLKIEGRMKSPSYVYGVTKIYRKLLDERRAATDKELSELQRLFSRSGFTDGYYTEKIDSRMLGVRTDKDISDSRSGSSFKADKIESVGVITDRRAVELPSKIDLPSRRPILKPITTASFRAPEQIPDSHDIEISYLPLSRHINGVNGVSLPPVIYDSQTDNVKRRLEKAVKGGARHVMLHNIGQLGIAAEFGLIPHGSHRFNTFNNYTASKIIEEAGLESLILSAELILPQIRDIVLPEEVRKGVIIYGRLPLMLLEKPLEKKSLRDGRGATFPVYTVEGRDEVYNSVNIYMADQTDRLDAAGVEERHMLFTTENKGEVMRALYAYSHRLPPKERESIKRIK